MVLSMSIIIKFQKTLTPNTRLFNCKTTNESHISVKVPKSCLPKLTLFLPGPTQKPKIKKTQLVVYVYEPIPFTKA